MMWGHRKGATICKPKKGPQRKSNLPTPWSWTPSLWNWKKKQQQKSTSSTWATQSVAICMAALANQCIWGGSEAFSHGKTSFSKGVLVNILGKEVRMKNASVVLPSLKCGGFLGNRDVDFINMSTSSDSIIHICQWQTRRFCDTSQLALINQGYFLSHQHFIKTKAYTSFILPNIWEVTWPQEGGEAWKEYVCKERGG